MDVTQALTRIRHTGSQPVFLLLHGWGSNELDLPDILAYCGAGDADFTSLRAPIPYGFGYTWFGSWAHEGVPEGESLDTQAAAACDAIDCWVSANIDETRPVIPLGFSQGGLLAGHLLRTNPTRYAAAVCCSGWLAPGAVDGDTALIERKPPVFYGHGALDDIFPADDVTAMSTFWQSHGTLDEHTYAGMGHSISMDELRDIQQFLQSNNLIRATIW